jgi:Flp pilus assembly pilin Flp
MGYVSENAAHGRRKLLTGNDKAIVFRSKVRVFQNRGRVESGNLRFANPMEDTAMAMRNKVLSLCQDEQGQDIAEYAVMLAVILVIVVGTIRLIGSNSNNVFSSVASSIK